MARRYRHIDRRARPALSESFAICSHGRMTARERRKIGLALQILRIVADNKDLKVKRGPSVSLALHTIMPYVGKAECVQFWEISMRKGWARSGLLRRQFDSMEITLRQAMAG